MPADFLTSTDDDKGWSLNCVAAIVSSGKLDQTDYLVYKAVCPQFSIIIELTNEKIKSNRDFLMIPDGDKRGLDIIPF